MAPLGHFAAQPACSRQDGRGALRDQRTPFCFLVFTESRAKLPYELQRVWTFFSDSSALASHFAAHKAYQTDWKIWGNPWEQKKTFGARKRQRNIRWQSILQFRGTFASAALRKLKTYFLLPLQNCSALPPEWMWQFSKPQLSKERK